jgi:TPP-dependent pyruvate/acetoin dehydrogenase alpha subunit
MELTNLGKLADPNAFNESIDISGQDTQVLLRQLKMMLLIRQAEEKIAEMVEKKIIKCPCHLGVGQEATAVGVSEYLRPTDRIFGAHRSHTHFLAAGGSLYELFSEVLGKETGCSKGMGGSMHLFDKKIGFLGSVPIVGASVPIAVGAGLAAKMDGRGDIAVSYLGDSALEEGGVQEALNLASVKKIPVIFVVENNFFASHLHINLRQPSDSTIRYAQTYGIESRVVDGNNVVEVMQAVEELTQKLRQGDGPCFIEAITYRWKGHVGHREDTDVGVNRKDDLLTWKKRDPIRRLVDSLLAVSALSINEYDTIQLNIIEEIENTWKRAEEAPFPKAEALFDLVYKK